MRLSSARFFLRRFLNRRGLESELQEEIESHLKIDEQLRVERGETAVAARNAILREFGNIALIKEVTRDMWGLSWLEQAAQDASFAARTFLRTPVFTLVAATVLAISIGGATAMFTAVYSILLRPLAFPDAGELMTIWEVPPQLAKPNVVALNNFAEWKRDSHSFRSMAAFVKTPMNVLSGGDSEQVPGLRVTADFFQVLGTPPLLGRTFRPGEYDEDAPREVVLSSETWQSRFGGRRDVIGKRISIDVSHHRIIGVMPPGFAIPGVQASLYVPLAIDLQEQGRNYSVIARLRGGITAAAAKAEIAAIAEHTAGEIPALNAGWSATVIPLLDYAVGDVRPVLLVLFAAVGLLLLIACANIANLLLMRSAHRTREISVRLALGAGPGRVVRQLIVESLLLSAMGGVLGIGLAFVSVRLMTTSLPVSLSIPRIHELRMDGTICAFSIGLTLLAGVLFGLAPALQTLKMDVVNNLRAAGRSVTSGATLRRLLVVAEVALASILVAAAGLMTRSFLRLTRVDPGFHPEHVLTVQMLLLPVRKEEWHAGMVDRMLQKIRALPGVLAAGSISILPMMGNSGTWYSRADRPEPPLNRRAVTDVSIITPGYLRAMGIPILEGRDFDERDRTGAPRVAMLNQTAAGSLFPGEDAVGKRVRVWWNNAPPLEIVGVAADIRHSQLNTPPDPCLFMPNDQAPFPFSSLVIRAIGEPGNLAPAIREQIRQVDSDQGVAQIESMRQLVADSVARPRLETLLLSGFGFGALLLACIGTYGVIAYSVTQRAREIGIRVALGATRLSVFRMVVGEGIRLTGAGIVIGLAGTIMLGRFLRGLLFDIQPADPVTLLSVSVLLALVAVLACYFPAARAMWTDPAVILREE
jgi:putative ABC transport system permease protein